ncbi:hypothetical protein L218DRAFT_898056 [Marasmius fiardii PR-910]|nr:hypothetical protein L218DRAFT_898056 [Marasmius fiardii PR-910]
MADSTNRTFLITCPKCHNVESIHSPEYFPVDLDALRFNVSPLPHERNRTLSILEKEEAELKRCDDELKHLGELVKTLRAEREVIAKRMEKRRSWIACIRKLPADVLQEIFSHVCLAYGHSLHIQEMSIDLGMRRCWTIQKPAMTLSQVSAYWRQVSSSCARLWCSIRVEVHNPPTRFRPILGIYIKNSASAPLDIHFRDPVRHEWTVSNRQVCLGTNGCYIIDTLMKEAFRMEKLVVDELHYSAFQTTEPRLLGFPILKSFVGHASEYDISLRSSAFMMGIGEAPLLRNVLLPRLPSSEDRFTGRQAIPIDLPYAHITSLKMGHINGSLEDFCKFIPRFINLERFIIQYVTSWSPHPSAEFNKLITLPSLHTFAITISRLPLDTFSNLFDVLDFPSLKLFKFSFNTTSCNFGLRLSQSFFSFLQRSSSLSRLNIFLTIHPFIPAKDLEDLLKSTPNLEYLSFTLNTDDEDSSSIHTLASVLSIKPEDDSVVIVPRLRELDVVFRLGDITDREAIGLLADCRSKERLEELGRSDTVSVCTSYVTW